MKQRDGAVDEKEVENQTNKIIEPLTVVGGICIILNETAEKYQ